MDGGVGVEGPNALERDEDMLSWSWEAAFHGSVHTATLAVATVLALFVLVLGTFGNGLVILSACRRRKVRSNFDLLILNLAGADLLLCVLLAPLYLYTLFADPPAPRAFCGAFLFGGTGCGLLSLLSIVAIAIHRQARVVGRAKRALTSRQTGLILAAVWFVSGAGALGGTLYAMLDWRDSYHNCQVLINSRDPLLHRFTLFFLGPVVLVSFVVIIVSYGVIARAVRAQSRARVQGLSSALVRPPPPPPVYRSATTGKQTEPLVQSKVKVKGRKNEKAKRVRAPPAGTGSGSSRDCHCCSCQAAAERENKAVTMCLVVILTLVLCWSPLVVSQFIELATGPSIILLQVKLCGIALVFLNSALDPYIYAQNQGHFKHRFGRLFWEMLRCECNNPSRTPFRVLRTRPLVLPRSSMLEVDTHSMAPADRGGGAGGGVDVLGDGGVRNEAVGVTNEGVTVRNDGVVKSDGVAINFANDDVRKDAVNNDGVRNTTGVSGEKVRNADVAKENIGNKDVKGNNVRNCDFTKRGVRNKGDKHKGHRKQDSLNKVHNDQDKGLYETNRRLIPTWLPPSKNCTFPCRDKTNKKKDVFAGAWQSVLGGPRMAGDATHTTGTTTSGGTLRPVKTKSTPLGVIYDVRTLVHKSCCHAQVEQSLVES